ncbi:MAG: hypothetical protein OEZ19_00070 [Paracoccaceae bacterium]|nr:hypothetical protein [Paracoccaceae bacterium]
MSVSREMTMEYAGETYRFDFSNKLLRRIDAGLAPQTFFGVLGVIDGREAPLPALAFIISEMLKEGGGEFTEDDVIEELYDDIRTNKGNGIRPLVEAIVACVSMPGQARGNSPAPAQGPKKAKAKAKRATPRP